MSLQTRLAAALHSSQHFFLSAFFHTHSGSLTGRNSGPENSSKEKATCFFSHLHPVWRQHPVAACVSRRLHSGLQAPEGPQSKHTGLSVCWWYNTLLNVFIFPIFFETWSLEEDNNDIPPYTDYQPSPFSEKFFLVVIEKDLNRNSVLQMWHLHLQSVQACVGECGARDHQTSSNEV